MSYQYNYTRKTLAGCNCSSCIVDVSEKTLSKTVEEALPGKPFIQKDSGTQTVFDFDSELSSGDQTILGNTHSAWTPDHCM